jgi:hypothetical protein
MKTAYQVADAAAREVKRMLAEARTRRDFEFVAFCHGIAARLEFAADLRAEGHTKVVRRLLANERLLLERAKILRHEIEREKVH